MCFSTSNELFIKLPEFIEHQVKRLAIRYDVMHYQHQNPFVVRKPQHATPNQRPTSEIEGTRRLLLADILCGGLARIRADVTQVALTDSQLLMFENLLVCLAVHSVKNGS